MSRARSTRRSTRCASASARARSRARCCSAATRACDAAAAGLRHAGGTISGVTVTHDVETRRTARRAPSCAPPTSRVPRSCSATAPAAASTPATWSRRRAPRSRSGSASRWSSSPTASRAGAPRAARTSSMRPGSRWSSTCGRARSADLPLVAGGRSSGARVACRTAEATGAIGVLCLAFPLRPPRREGARAGAEPAAELEAVDGPGARRAGRARPVRHAAGRPVAEVVVVQGDHSLRGMRRRSRRRR